MLTAKGQEDNARSNGSAVRFPLASLVTEGRSLEKSKTTKSYPRGAVLFTEGQQSRGVYLLSEGRAKISIGSSEGKTLVLRIAQPGDLLGVNAALTGEIRRRSFERQQTGPRLIGMRLALIKAEPIFEQIIGTSRASSTALWPQRVPGTKEGRARQWA